MSSEATTIPEYFMVIPYANSADAQHQCDVVDKEGYFHLFVTSVRRRTQVSTETSTRLPRGDEFLGGAQIHATADALQHADLSRIIHRNIRL